MNPVVHFELPTEDRNRMADFNTRAFGWKTQLLGEDMGNYVLATTTETDDHGMPKTPGAINGGFYVKDAGMQAEAPSIVIGVDDINAAMKNVTNAGGKIFGEPNEIPGYGTYVSFFDTEGNRIGIMQPSMNWSG
jgi:uncharacterized protein